ncbi:conserved hypothetical protein [Candidatus Competibacter denitrificans Run_A_D11]|uniref:Uncharacterized protein n=2 Tax=Candidatus Competibacter TaxID=221279 RepID=W6M8C2_9GAMM|nr:conserved hypothetical protein [Candidatus Competibacter denitrificans Run_A_D11]
MQPGRVGTAHLDRPSDSVKRRAVPALLLVLSADPAPFASLLAGQWKDDSLPTVYPLCKVLHKENLMATNLALDPDLLDRVLAVSGEPTKKAAVTLALKEFLARREQKKVAELFGKLEWDETFDYKAERSRP